MGAARLAGWGRQFVPGTELLTEDLEAAPLWRFRGLGRSYGDSALPPPTNPRVVTTTRANRILSFDPASGKLRAEAGLSLLDLNALFLPRGYFPPVTPGTQFVTLGGAVAADVHGKNHHAEGCFGRHVTGLKLRVASGALVECGPAQEAELFRATVGGMGLTGNILEVEFSMVPIPTPWIFQETERVESLEEYIDKLAEAGHAWPMTVGWIDCVRQGAGAGRGILMKGRWAQRHEAPTAFPKEPPRLRVPFEAPAWALSKPVVQAFNFAYYWRHLARKRQGLATPSAFFYPLDFVQDWNLGYGKRGFTQYQCVVPTTAGPGAARRVLDVLTRAGEASFLCVIKDCGAQGDGLLSFPMPGISIAVDLPVRAGTRDLVAALNEQVLAEGGRIYLAKDSFTTPAHFRAMEAARLDRFQAVRDAWDPDRVFRSAQSVRLLGDPP
jgi:FAD/FMN-containing dehydrogenase